MVVVIPPTPQEVDNLWHRIEMQFSLPQNDNKQVASQLNWYRKHPKYIERMSKRAEPYLFFIVQEIEKSQHAARNCITTYRRECI